MASEKTIPLDAVRLAYVSAKARRHGVISAGRFAAFTDCPLVGIDCDDTLRGRRPYRLPACHFLPLARGAIANVVERTRLQHGLQEVRRTWGTGYRALQRELSAQVMR